MNLKRITNLKISGTSILLILICFLFHSSQIYGQGSITGRADSAAVKAVSLEKIPATAAKTVVLISQIKESLITRKQIESIRVSDAILIARIDSLLDMQRDSGFLMISNRNLRNQIDFWNEERIEIRNSVQRLELIVKKLSDAQGTLDREMQFWKNIKQKTDSLSSLNVIIKDITNQIKSVNEQIFIKTNDILQLLNYAQITGLKLDSSISAANEAIQKQMSTILSRSHPSIFQFKYISRENFEFSKHIKQFYSTDISLLIHFFRIKKDIFFFYLFYLSILLLLFYLMKSRVNFSISENPTLFEIALRKIFQLPFYAATTLGLFSVLFFFENRPQFFNDLVLLLFAIPLIKIFLAITTNIKSKYFYLLGFLIVLRMVIFIFPPETLLHRLIIMLMGVIEVIVSLDLYAFFKKQKFDHPVIRFVTNFFVILHLLIASAAIIGNIYGSVLLASLAVNFVITNTLIGFMVTVSVLILIGLIQTSLNGSYLEKLNLIRNHRIYLISRTASTIILLGSFIWLWSIFRVLGVSDDIANFISRLLSTEYKLGSTSFTIGRILLLFFIIWLSTVISRLIRVILEEDILLRMPLKKGVPRMIAILTHYTLVTIGIFLAVSAAGMSFNELTIIIGAFSVGIGFGLQNIFNNLVSGMILLIERPIQIGDVVEVGPLLGQVKSMGIRSSNLRTFDGAEVIVPNGNLISNEVINWTLSDKRKRIEIISGVAYGSDTHKVQELFYRILEEHPDVMKDPKPSVFFNNMSDSSLDFRLLFWTEDFDNWVRIRSEVMFRIYDVLNEEGIEIPFPQRDVHIKTR